MRDKILIGDRTEEDVLRAAILTFGSWHQLLKLVEEASELQKEVCKDLIGEGNVEQIAEEVADLEITLDQLVMIYDIEGKVSGYREKKLLRLGGLCWDEHDQV